MTTHTTWHEPVQERGRERVAKILQSASRLVLETGHLDIKMTHVAKSAGIPIGSVYQFFPTRDALIGQLYATQMTAIDESLREGIAQADSLDTLISGIRGTLANQLSTVKRRPILALIWSSASSHPAIRKADLANTQKNASVLCDRICALGNISDHERAKSTALIVCHVWGSVIQLCLDVDEVESERMLDAYAAMIQASLRFPQIA